MDIILNYIAQIVSNLILSAGYFGIMILMALESACIPIPSELIMPFAGFQVFQGNFSFWPVVFWGVLAKP